jgi:ribosomal protein S17E
MKNINDFDVWKYINEKKFNAEIKNVEKEDNSSDIKDNIIVKETENSEPIIYSIDGNSITSNQKQTGIGINGKPNGQTTNDTKEITDTQLKYDIKKAAYAIRDIKDRLYSKEILRLTGGDISESTDIVRKIIDSFHDTQEKSFETNKESQSSLSLAKSIKNETFTYISINQNRKWKGKYNLIYNDIKDIYNQSFNSVGKGEYLLPLLFDDVHKISTSTTDKGDDYLIDSDNKKYFIEVKGPHAFGKFSNYKKLGGGVIQFLNNNNLIKTKDNILDIYKTAIAASLLDYAHKQFGKTYSGGYLCLFAEKEPEIKNKSKRITSPIGMLFINVSNIEDSDFHINNQLKDTSEFKSTGLLEQIKQKLIINIDEYDNQVGADFVYSCVGDENPQILCKLTYDHMKTVRDFLQLPNIEKRKPGGQPKQLSKTEESAILSRDNFVNEIYTK